jgi:predicted MPP superfamily phosphohydrolase
MKKSYYSLADSSLPRGLRFAVVSDLHAQDPRRAIEALREIQPTHILMAGDILEALDGSCDGKNERAFSIFESAAKIAPTFYCTGNHEDGGVHSERRKWKREHSTVRCYTDENIARIEKSGVHFLLDSYVMLDGFAIGGLASGLILEGGEPDLEFLHRFAELDTPKALICHHPEYFEKYIRELPIDLMVSGHAHGGQWRFFGRGVYAPGQGLFPKYTSGIHEGRLVISKGLKKTVIPPRIFNSTEIVIIDIE